ncbi:hypothetical protein [Allomeiothermus silvanus]|uniref:hypothetical protein n=1 Tax=Allomeiothermus silvanus TaxID=52022 RepID=UPI0023559F7C|nr:hypothetical protein [Allomeiothermus silvanus]MBI5812213.1 hypothetical protein [Allomeiothermus silvanus]
MRRVFAVLLGLVLGSGWAQDWGAEYLSRCQEVADNLRFQFMYLERVSENRWLLRVVLGRAGFALTRLTLDALAEPVQIGLEDLAQALTRQDSPPDPQLLRRFTNRLQRLQRELNLANYVVLEPRGYRCFLTYLGRVVGILRFTQNNFPRPEPRWREAYLRAAVRYPEPGMAPDTR